MKLIRRNQEKERSVFFDGSHYIKVWGNVSPRWISTHVRLLREIVPNYVHDYGGNWISFNVIEGVPASTLEHTPEFVDRIYKFCLDNIKQTMPYVHGDWSLSNMIVNGDKITLCDWDNLGEYPEEEVRAKLHEDMKSAFGELFQVTAVR